MVYYRVIPSKWMHGAYRVQIWRWYWPFWVEAIDYMTEQKAAEFIKGHSTYYDGAE